MCAQGAFAPLADDPAADLFALTRELTDAAGLPAYEISNHARPGEESRHNLAYWRYQDYVGIGPGAHGRRGGHGDACGTRSPRTGSPRSPRNGHGIAEERALAPREQAAEALLMGLRLREGIDLGGAGAALRPRRRRADRPRQAGVPRSRSASSGASGERIGVTAQGMPLLDALLGELVPDALAAA